MHKVHADYQRAMRWTRKCMCLQIVPEIIYYFISNYNKNCFISILDLLPMLLFNCLINIELSFRALIIILLR